jgi:hypothetical protein
MLERVRTTWTFGWFLGFYIEEDDALPDILPCDLETSGDELCMP